MKLARSSFKQPGVKGSGCYQHMVDEWPPLRVVDDYLDRRAKRPSEHFLRRGLWSDTPVSLMQGTGLRRRLRLSDVYLTVAGN